MDICIAINKWPFHQGVYHSGSKPSRPWIKTMSSGNGMKWELFDEKFFLF